MRNAALVIATIAALSACAAISTPDGGAFDEIPPRVTGSNPAIGATGVRTKKITIDFSEFIKIENASEKVVVSPPQKEQPEIKVNGKKIQVELFDSLKENTTYSIDFSDGIVDNNEGNPLGDFCFRFSTGDAIDTLEVSGYVLNAEDLEPVKGMTVGLHSDLSDSAFTTKPFERVSRTDSYGHFTIRGVAPGRYRIYAVMDMDGTFSYSARNEMIAWSDSIIVPDSEIRFREDSIFNDDGTLDTLQLVQYTRFMPDDITLLAFTAPQTNRYITKAERDRHEKATVIFSVPLDSMPDIEGINFNDSNAYVLQHSLRYDTLTFWMKDTMVYYMDTLRMGITYLGTDSIGNDLMRTDTLELVPKKSREAIVKEELKKAAEKQEELDRQIKRFEKNNDTLALQKLLAPPPVKFLNVKFDGGSGINPYKQIGFRFAEPVTFLSDTAVHVYQKKDSILTAIPFELEQDSIDIMAFRIYAEWKPEESYEVIIDSASIQGIWGLFNNRVDENISFAALSRYSTLTVNVVFPKPGYNAIIIKNNKNARQLPLENGSADFFLLEPGEYYVSLLDDVNGNGKWDTGDYDLKLQPESVYYIDRKFTLKADWYHETDPWDVHEMPLTQQKPKELSKESKEKKKVDIHKKNVERLEKKASQIEADRKKKERKRKERQERREHFRSLFKAE